MSNKQTRQHAGRNQHDPGSAVKEHEFSFEDHEGVLIATASFEESIPYEQAQTRTEAFLKEVAECTASLGGMVCHIKAAVEGDTKVSTFSTTGAALHVNKGTLETTHIVMALLVMNIAREVFEMIITETLAKQGEYNGTTI